MYFRVMEYPFKDKEKADAAIAAVQACSKFDQMGVNLVLFGGTISAVRSQGWRGWLKTGAVALGSVALGVAATHIPFLAPLLSLF